MKKIFFIKLLDRQRNPILVFLILLAIYLPFQEWLLLYIGNDATLSFAVVPILFSGWFLGPLWAGWAGCIMIVCYALVKFLSFGTDALMEMAVGTVSVFVFTLIGIAIGRVEQLNRQLKKELEARRAAEMALARSNRELEQFAYIASHDLQEPLRKITSFSSRLVSKYKDTLGEQGIDYLSRMENATVRMQSLIEGLLTYSRVTTKAQPFSSVSLGAIIAGVLSDLETAIRDSGATVTCGELPSVEADPLQMRQLFQNLIGNALKYHAPGVAPAVTVNASCVRSTCTITVSDNGIGFEQKYAEQIFGVFQRLHGRSSEYKGSGIGLSVCRKIVDRHGGTITARGELDKGATFTVQLPLRQKQDEAAPAGNG
jgi:light-regulated signal transduction histidine kinase (bacteriophytochrome)